MAVRPVSEFQKEFVARTAKARDRSGMTQEEMATLLGIEQGTYKNYETIRPMPHHLVVPFCLATKVELEWLYGRPAKRAKALQSRLKRAI